MIKVISHIAMLLLCLLSTQLLGVEVSGTVRSNSNPIADALVVINPGAIQTFTDSKGHFSIEIEKRGEFQIQVHQPGFKVLTQDFTISEQPVNLELTLQPLAINLNEVSVQAEQVSTGVGMARLSSVDGVAIYAAKKNEVILLDSLTGNKATNNARQVYAKVPGLNIWESDQAGVQLGIGARGLSPNRTSNFNTRQNGYDIAADALGYPESYYTPPVEAIERIELVRGAASLQYGTQFGGMLNFRLKRAPVEDGIKVNSRQTVGSYGLFTSYNAIRARKGKWGVSTFYQYKRSDGWRPNSELQQHTGHIHVSYKINPKMDISAEYTHMQYLAHQPGGLTDLEFEDDPSQSKRERNWFRVKWNVFNLNYEYRISNKTILDVRNFGLIASREALGNLGRINRLDDGGNRTYILGEYENWGNETRLLHHYKLVGKPVSSLVGIRVYRGNSQADQGDANNSDGPDFEFNNPSDLEGSSFTFPSWNIAAFTEHVFRVTDRFSVTPGLRYEYIATDASGWYKQIVRNMSGDIISSQTFPEERSLERNFVLAGLGLGYKLPSGLEFYGNFSQNYRAITFNDIRIDNPNFRVDPDISDEFGYNVDLGIRGTWSYFLNYDLSFYYLAYNNRIGFVTGIDSVTYLEQRIRTNVGDSRSYGIEGYAEVDFWKLIAGKSAKTTLSWFVNLGLLSATYISSEDPLVEGNDVELVPPVNIKTGLNFVRGKWKASYQFTYVSAQFTDAYNTEEPVSTAISGEIPSYMISDLSGSFHHKWLQIEAGVNNLLDESYFTRRATGYPGPGIIPSDPRTFYLTVGVNF